MSTYADPTKAYAWLDGDIFRAPAGTALPTDPFAPTVTTGTAPGVTWDAFGGVEAGFEVNPSRDIKTLPVWNRRKAPYKVIKGPLEERVKFRAVDYSKATVLTALQGGSITEIGSGSGIFKWEPGDDEDFAAIFRLSDDDGNAGFYVERATLTTPPPRVFGGETLDGFEFELLALTPIIPLTDFNPLAP
ncbi:hypothetical protein [Rhodococcus sp. AH-ZY2]|uniref:phage tail tube protein n=1 Tax=Rhodococcus sp. AH-ZY2 TaxID=3047468 RepID=UPI0027E0AC5F|nr:hypothetical protein [Rhodococcus sp. AH-ZY2]WML63660.1 hypothetical protein QNA09_02240 [Rhodococcus sp. AH-ZY2]